ncbi:aminotransferase class IV [Actomonas aquatica]|uniref:branched-chain-amino-acid transaminase n=1 Tax=Actomonas aquatica TaxID=2866162 RepID=A0ABZ1C3G9_9BACT|nr:aminotransferase class IV [Opitutus sp. WL0086]WRQ86263.1 aminotransferase class IV [Opitutus sp. WL0086]
MLQPYYEKNANLIVNLNGRLVHRDEAGVSPFDSAVQNGDAVWEGLRLYAGRVFRLQAHLDRLRRSAELLQYAGYPDDETLVRELVRTFEANGMFDHVHVRLTVSRGLKYTSGLDPRINTRGCSFFILPEWKPPVYDKSGITLATAQHRRPPPNVLNQHIHSCNQLTSILAKLEANAAGVDDALMLDLQGNLAETNATHVFGGRGDTLHTSTTVACPEGITRSTVLELCRTHDIPHEVRDIPRAELDEMDELFVTGTMGELVPVVRLDGRTFKPGPLYARLSELFAGEVARSADPLLVETR